MNRGAAAVLVVPYNTPHSPMQVPDEFWNKMKNKSLNFLSDTNDDEDVQFTKAALNMV